MHHRRDPWKWPVCGLTVALMLGAVFIIPHNWIQSFFSPLDLSDLESSQPPSAWMTILPPPTVLVARPDEPLPVDPEDRHRSPREDPRWWTEGWAIRRGTEMAGDLAPAPPDSAEQLLVALGLGEDFMTRVKPDSVLVSRLLILQQEDSFKFDELKPYIEAMGRAHDYADILSRAADMYDEHLSSQIMVPD